MSEEIKEYRLVKVNIEKLRISQKKYYEKNKERIQQWQRENKRLKYIEDPEFREKEKKMFTFASKVYEYVPKKAKMELELLNKLTNIVRMDMCPHFPILYGYVLCKKFLNNQDSFIKSKEEDKTISQNIRNFPELVRLNKSSIIITTFNELANGDLWNFLKIYNNNIKLLANAIIQKFISIMFFNYYTNRAHMDTHPGNFLLSKL